MTSNGLAVGATLLVVIAFVAGTPLAPDVVDGKGASVPDVQVERGDVVYITVSSNQRSTVNVGGPNAGFWIQIPNFEGKTTIGLNTYETGSGNESDLVAKGPTSDIVVKRWSQVGPIESATIA